MLGYEVTIREPMSKNDTAFHMWTGLPLSRELQTSPSTYNAKRTTEIFSNARNRPFIWPERSFTPDTAVQPV